MRLIFSALCLSVPLSAQAPVLPTPTEGLTVRAGESPSTLLQVAEGYAKSLGLDLAVNEDVRTILGNATAGLLVDADVPAERLHGVAQSLLVLGGFVISGVDGELRISAYTDGEHVPFEIAEEELEGLAGSEALLVKIQAEVPGVDSRQLTTSLRTLATPGIPGPVLTASPEGAFWIEGPAESVRRLIDVLRRCAPPGASDAEDATPEPLGDWRALFPPPGDADARFRIEPGEKLLDVLTRYSAATGRALWLEEHLRGQLQFQDCGLLTTVDCPIERAHALVEALLVQQQVSITVRGEGAHAVHALQRGYWRAVTRPVLVELAREDLAGLRDHPATVFGGVLRIDSLDTRMLTTSLRVLMTDVNTQAALALDGKALYLHGGGAATARLAALVLGMDGRAAVGGSAAGELATSFGDEPVALGELGEAKPSLLDLMVLFAQHGGRAAALSDVDTRFLANQPVEGLGKSITVAELHAVIERELADRGFSLALLSANPSLITLTGMTNRRPAVHRYVAAGELDQLANEPTLLVTTLIPLKNLEARQAAMRMRPMLTDLQQEHILAAGNRQLVIGGAIAQVRANIELLRGYDEAGELPEPPRGR